MFGLFKTECPVEENEKKWIDDSLAWFYSPSREIEFRNFESIIIARYFPSDNIVLKEEHLYKIFEKVRKHLVFGEELICEVVIVDPDQIPLPEGLMLKAESGDPISCSGYISKNKFILEVNSKYLNAPLFIVSSVASSLAFYKLRQEKVLEDVNGFINELATLVFGFGVFQANSVISQNRWSGISHSGWSVGEMGFLSQQMFGYALAVSAFIKEESNPEWAKYLCKDVKAYFDRSNKFIQSNMEFYTKYKNELIVNVNSVSLPPDYCYTRKTNHENGRLYFVSEMKNGYKDGITTYYHKNGVLWAEWEYKKDVPWNVTFNNNNKSEPQEKGTLVNGTGLLYSYDDDGKLMFIAHYENGKLLKNEIF